MSLRKIFTRVKENMLENLCTEEVERKIEIEVVKVGNTSKNLTRQTLKKEEKNSEFHYNFIFFLFLFFQLKIGGGVSNRHPIC